MQSSRLCLQVVFLAWHLVTFAGPRPDLPGDTVPRRCVARWPNTRNVRWHVQIGSSDACGVWPTLWDNIHLGHAPCVCLLRILHWTACTNTGIDSTPPVLLLHTRQMLVIQSKPSSTNTAPYGGIRRYGALAGIRDEM